MLKDKPGEVQNQKLGGKCMIARPDPSFPDPSFPNYSVKHMAKQDKQTSLKNKNTIVQNTGIKQNILFWVPLIVVLTFLVYSNIFNNSFNYDDTVCIVNNDTIKNIDNLHYLFSSDYFKLFGESSYRPIVTISNFIDFYFWNLDVAGWHFTNVLLHAINSILVFFFVFRLIRSSTFAALTAVLFSLHPVQTEVVNGISFREDAISLLFFLSSFLLYIKYLDSKKVIDYMLFCSFFVLSIFAKETAVILPAIIVLYNLCFLKKWCIKPKDMLGYLIIIVLYLILKFTVFDPILVSPGFVKREYLGGSLINAMYIFATSLLYYFKVLLYPVNLCLDYSNYFTYNSYVTKEVIVSMLINGVILFFAYRSYKKNPEITFFVLFFYISLLPTSGIIPFSIVMAERYLYYSSISFCFILILLIYKLFNAKNEDIKRISFIGWILIILITSFYAKNTFLRNKDWESEFSLWSQTVNINPNAIDGNYNMAKYYSDTKDFMKAIYYYKKAIEADPKSTKAYNNLSNSYSMVGDFNNAIKVLKKGIEIDPAKASLYYNLGMVYSVNHNSDIAILNYKKAIELDNKYIDAYISLSIEYRLKKDIRNALNELSKAESINSNYPLIYYNLGKTYEITFEYNKAISSITKGLSIDNDQRRISYFKNYLNKFNNKM